MNKTDELDRLLSRLPLESHAGALSGRVYRYVRLKRRRKMAIHFAVHFVLIGSGLWLIAPVFTASSISINISGSALSVLEDWIRVASGGIESYADYVWNGLVDLQNSLIAPIDISVVLGVVVLSLSLLLLLGQMVPRSTNFMVSKGGKA